MKSAHPDLITLHQEFISKGYNNFFIAVDGIRGPRSDDVMVLDYQNELWSVYYTERGNKSAPEFSSPVKSEAINYYRQLVSKIDHLHLAVVTRDERIISKYRDKLLEMNFRLYSNDIKNMYHAGDKVYRLYIINDDIYRIKDVSSKLPYYDDKFEDWKKFSFLEKYKKQ